MMPFRSVLLHGSPPIRVQGLTPSAEAFVISFFFQRQAERMVIIVPDNAEAERLVADIGFFFGDVERIVYLPQWETLPYEPVSNTPEIAAQRHLALARLALDGGRFLLVTTPAALLQKAVEPSVAADAFFLLQPGAAVDRKTLEEFFALTGYEHGDPVREPGTFAFRGGLLDCWPPQERMPFRVEFFGDEVETVRRFDPGTQRSMGGAVSVTLVPAREPHYYGTDIPALLARTDAFARDTGKDMAFLRIRLENRQFFPGMERFLSLFYPSATAPLWALPNGAALIVCGAELIAEHLALFHKEIETGYGEALGRVEHVPPPSALYEPTETFEQFLQETPGLRFSEIADEPDGPHCLTISARDADRLHGVFSRFIYDCRQRLATGGSLLFVARGEETLNRVSSLLAEEEMGFVQIAREDLPRIVQEFSGSEPPAPRLMATIGNLSAGFLLEAVNLAVITEEEVFGRHALPRRRERVRRAAAFATDFSDVKPGDFVVHRDHGIGLYHGMKTVSAAGAADEYLEIEYAEDQRLFLPISSTHLLEKHSSGGGHRPVLDRIGGQTWAKTRERVKKGIMRMAKELLEIQARRNTGKAHAFSPDGHFHREFADSFGFAETPDQALAIADVAGDMEADKPMDRLVCGDVGYGKTEVAMRAAFKAALDGRQTAVLAPTTLLVNQHLANFKRRMEPFGIKVAALSRFVPAKERSAALAALTAGGVDIVIGTHRLLQKDVSFAKLGLVIIDEEQRFGVAHKERLKQLRETVDVLTLTATPIPRTLHMAVSGIREISVINTPPPERLSIKTAIRKFGDETVVEAVNRELSRGGQVFFVHNSVQSINRMLAYLQKIVPGARMAAAHGQMSGTELEEIMERFIRHRLDVLVCTTIIESGLDIPNANTIVVNRADKFGLAQLYQLRGRVGRGRHRAYAYLLVPGTLSPVARKRMKAIEELSELGSGFKLAARDMEIRGAGNLLGSQQSGHINDVGFETYCRMLEEAVEELKTGVAPEGAEVILSLDFAGKLEESYIPALDQRMNLYSRIHKAESADEIRQAAEELADRFGPLPDRAQKLFDAAFIRWASGALGLERVELAGGMLGLFLRAGSHAAPAIAAETPAHFKGGVATAGPNALKIDLAGIVPEKRPSSVAGFLVRCANAVSH
ncbi:MAG: transcription-repair coupling factor [Nitrospinae bacterium]|nr:transcription-repair coupling factor [Nitrospinota bacterium]